VTEPILHCASRSFKQSELLVYAVVLNWNSYEESVRCVLALEGLDYSNLKIILVDNASSDGSGVRLNQKFPAYTFIQTATNLGYAGGNNQAIRSALRDGAEFIWIINPDVIVINSSLAVMVRAMNEDASIGVCGPRILNGVHSEIEVFDGSFVCSEEGYAARPCKVETGSELLPDVVDTEGVIGCSMLVRASVFKQIGLLREDFFLYLEETEFCLRAHARGWRVTVCRKAINEHRWNFRKKGGIDAYYFTRNRVLLARILRRHVWRTVWICLGVPNIRKVKFLDWLRVIYRNYKPVFYGLFQPLRPIPKW